MSFKFYLIIQFRDGSSEFMSESPYHLKSIDDVVKEFRGDDIDPVSILEITDDSAPLEVKEDVARALHGSLSEEGYDDDYISARYSWIFEAIDRPEIERDYRIDEAAQYRASVL